MITQDELKNLLSYDPHAGRFVWRISRGSRAAGTVVNSKHGDGYITVRLNGRSYLAHRLAFIYMTGDCPKEVDHRNGNRADNRWANLREATRTQNNANAKIHSTNTSGVKGVRREKGQSRWRVQISINSKTKHIGYFASKDEAITARREIAERVYGDFARHV